VTPAPPGSNPDVPPRNDQAGPQQGVEPLATGPVHEAFGQPRQTKPAAGPIVPKQPPPPIPEQPPDQKPEGENVVWIPGYWFWQPDKQDFIWVSGFWRVPPPGRRWVPGYWRSVDDGAQWVPGFWAPADQTDLQYLPQPPASVDNGPSVPAPDDRSIYIPGSWVYENDDYVWQPGYWTQAESDYIYTPPSYSWTPSGYVYVSGYWDYPLVNRGLLFAPCAFDQPYWSNPGWFYRPYFTVDCYSLLDSLFCWPSYYSYCFGNYYPGIYASSYGIYPWWWWGRRHHDCLFGYYGWRHRFDPGWYEGLRDRYWGRYDGTLVRPPRTFAEQRRLVAGGAGERLRPLRPLDQVGRSVHLTRVTAADRNFTRQGIRHVNDLRVQRSRAESAARGVARGERPAFRLPAAANAGRVTTAPRTPRPPVVRRNELVSPGPVSGGRGYSGPVTTQRPAFSTTPGRPYRGGPAAAPQYRGVPEIHNLTPRTYSPPRVQQLPQIHNVVPRSYSPAAAPRYTVPHYSAPHYSAPHFSAPHHYSAPAFHGGGGHAGHHR
jgi:hypothetical protein